MSSFDPHLGSNDPTQHLAWIAAARHAADAIEARGGSSLIAAGALRHDRVKSLAASLPGYDIESEIHRGGQGVVYRALQRGTQRTVAIKLLHAAPGDGATEQARFEREVFVLGRLRHPNIVTIHDSGTALAGFYFVMDYVDGRPVDRFVREQQLAPRAVARLFLPIAEAVTFAQQHGVIHRDLKPGNVLVSGDGVPHVLDFGLAKLNLDDSAAAATLTGEFVGSLPWSSPEQVSGDSRHVDVRTDVYALGVMLYHALVGEFPYPVVGPIRTTIDNICNAVPPRLVDKVEACDEELDAIVQKCLHKDPDQRYQAVGELHRDLQRYLAGEPIEAKRDSTAYLLRTLVRKHRGALFVGTAMLVLLLGGLAGTSYGLLQAREAARREGEARRDAEARAREAQQIAEFQSAQLADVDPQAMGVALIDGLDERRRRASSQPAAAPADGPADWRAETLAANPTDVALELLDRFVLAAAAETAIQEFAEQPLVLARLQQSLADTYRELGLYEKARLQQQAALETRIAHLGATHPDAMKSRVAAAELDLALSRADAAAATLNDVLQEQVRQFGPNDLRTIATRRQFALALQAQGDLAGAEREFRAARAAATELGGGDDSAATSDGDLATLLMDRGEWAEAETLLRAALAELPEDGPGARTRPDLLSNLGVVCFELGRPDEAVDNVRAAWDAARDIFGDRHPKTLSAARNYFSVLSDRGAHAEAIAGLEATLADERDILGELHLNPITTRNNLGHVFRAAGRLPEAEQAHRTASEFALQTLGPEHALTLMTRFNLAVDLRHQGRNADAEVLHREVLEIRRRVLGPRHPETLTSLSSLTAALAAQQRYDEAAAAAEEAYLAEEELLGANNPRTLTSRYNLAATLRLAGEYATAETHVRAILAGLRATVGDADQQVVNSLEMLGWLRIEQDAPAEGLEFAREAVAAATAVFGAEDWRVARCGVVLGKALLELGEYDECRTVLIAARDRLRTQFGPTHRYPRNADALLQELERRTNPTSAPADS